MVILRVERLTLNLLRSVLGDSSFRTRNIVFLVFDKDMLKLFNHHERRGFYFILQSPFVRPVYWLWISIQYRTGLSGPCFVELYLILTNFSGIWSFWGKIQIDNLLYFSVFHLQSFWLNYKFDGCINSGNYTVTDLTKFNFVYFSIS